MMQERKEERDKEKMRERRRQRKKDGTVARGKKMTSVNETCTKRKIRDHNSKRGKKTGKTGQSKR